MSKDIFNRLLESARGVELGNAPRWIRKSSEEDSQLLAQARIDGLKLGRKLGASLQTCGDHRYVSLVGFENTDFNIEGLERIESTPAHFQLTVLAIDLAPTGTESDIRDALEGRDGTDAHYEGHELNEIAALYPNIDHFEVLPDAPIATLDIGRILGIAICKSEYDIPLSLNESLRQSFIEVFEESPSEYPTFLALQALVSAFWQTQFLEIYRTVEQLFAAHSVSTLAAKIAYTETAASLYSTLSDVLGWRPREDGALERLVLSVPSDIVEQMRQIFDIKNENENWKSLVARRIYDVRNSNVHFRAGESRFQLDDRSWARLNEAMTRMSLHLYAAVGASYLSKLAS